MPTGTIQKKRVAIIANISAASSDLKTVKSYEGELLDLQSKRDQLPAVYVWYEGETFREDGQHTYERVIEWHALFVASHASNATKRRQKIDVILDDVLDSLSDFASNLIGVETLVNDDEVVIMAVKFNY